MYQREQSVYKQYLVEEEKFLKNLEKNVQDHINRLKVEELTLLKLISSASNNVDGDEEENTSSQESPNDVADHELSDGISNQNYKQELQVNTIPIDLGLDTAIFKVELNETKQSGVVETICEEEDDKSESDSEHDSDN
ncbi:snRNA-activating protein complex subunit 5-like [Clytia hemisphaerica]|eukprot:TCONS_00057903-protein